MSTVIWDGIEFLEVEGDVAQVLAKADKAQIMEGVIDGLSLKTRDEFTGYSSTPVPPPTPKPKTQQKAEGMKTTTLKDWRAYRKIVGDTKGIPMQRVTKVMVEEHLKGE